MWGKRCPGLLLHLPGTELQQREDEKHGPPALLKVKALLYTGMWGLEWERAPPIFLAAPASNRLPLFWKTERRRGGRGKQWVVAQKS